VEEVGQFIVPPLNFADGEEAQNDLREPFRPGGSGADLLKIDQLVADGDEGREAGAPGEQSLAPLQRFGEVGFEGAYVFVPSAFIRGVAPRVGSRCWPCGCDAWRRREVKAFYYPFTRPSEANYRGNQARQVILPDNLMSSANFGV